MTSTATIAEGLCARTREVEPPADLISLLSSDGFAWLHDGIGFVTAGVVARVAPDLAAKTLAAIEHDDASGLSGAGVRAVGALPFRGAADGDLIIPARITGLDAGGRAWETVLAPAAHHSALRLPHPTRFTLRARPTRTAWRASVERALAMIHSGELVKVVLARKVTIDTDEPLDIRRLAAHLLGAQSGCFVYSHAGLVGASPELLVRRVGARVTSRPMAGTVIRDGDAAHDALAADTLSRSTKDALEHRPVVDAVVAALRESCDDVIAEPHPQVVPLANVAHLATTITARVELTGASAAEIACALHPTPAVGGTPRGTALDAIADLEAFNRDRYAGPVGWVDADGDGEWAVALRCGEIDGHTAQLFAGAGIVEGSEPDAEWAETQAKLEPMLDAVLHPGL
ncbi:MAG TPA: isochorismate synthase [Acidimicrobiia bacterium]